MSAGTEGGRQPVLTPQDLACAETMVRDYAIFEEAASADTKPLFAKRRFHAECLRNRIRDYLEAPHA